MSRDREAEIDSLRRENEQLRREVARRREAGRARRFVDSPAVPHEPVDAPAMPSSTPDEDRLADHLADAINAIHVDLTTALDSGVWSVASKLDELNNAVREEAPARERELNRKLEQIASEIQQLRMELDATRRHLVDTSDDDNRLGGVSSGGIIIDHDEILDQERLRRWRSARRPWFYLPLVWGLVLLVLVLVALLIWW